MFLMALLRWSARLLATAAAALFIGFLVSGNAPDVRALTDAELLGLGTVFVMLLGTLLGWRWDLLGGGLLAAGYALLALLQDGWPPLPFAPFGFAGAVLSITGGIRRVRGRRRPAVEATAA